MTDQQYENLKRWIEENSKHCPSCNSTQITTRNNEWPLRHRCLDCEQEFTESQSGEIIKTLKEGGV